MNVYPPISRCLVKQASYCCGISLAVGISPVLKADEMAAGLGVASRYITEGRDNTFGHALQFAELTSEVKDYTVAVWLGGSSYHSYREASLNLSRGWNHSSWFSTTIGYSYILFSDGAASDQEVSVELLAQHASNIDVSWLTYYSAESSGFYSQLKTQYSVAVSELFSFIPFISLGANNGYVPYEHTGVDHYLVGANLEWSPANFTFRATVSASKPVAKERTDELVHATWLELSLYRVF